MLIVDDRNMLFQEVNEEDFQAGLFIGDQIKLEFKSFLTLELKRRNDFVLVDIQTLLSNQESSELFKALINTFIGVIFFYDEDDEVAKSWIEKDGQLITNVLGVYSLPMRALSRSILLNQIHFLESYIHDQIRLQKSIAEFSHELDEVLKNAENEIQRAKSLSEVLAPPRKEEIKGITFTNKYHVGEGRHSEFYDLHQIGTKIYQIAFSTESYLVSSAILSLLAQARKSYFEPREFCLQIDQEYRAINSAKGKKIFLDLMILELDLNSLELKSLTNSEVELYGLDSGKFHLKKEESRFLKRGEKVVVFSSGFLFNWRSINPQKDLYEFLKHYRPDSNHELFSELFIHLKENTTESKIEKDAIVVMMEVNRHGIYKV